MRGLLVASLLSLVRLSNSFEIIPGTDITDILSSPVLPSVSSLACRLGLDIEVVLGALVPAEQLPTIASFLPLLTCVCREGQLLERIEEGGFLPINLCPGTITLSNPIDVTDKRITINCNTPGFFNCGIESGGDFRLFQGSPTSLSITGVALAKGKAEKVPNMGRALKKDKEDKKKKKDKDEEDEDAVDGVDAGPVDGTPSGGVDFAGNPNIADNEVNLFADFVPAGGAMYLTGGTTELNNVSFNNNRAGAGGALYIGPGASVTATGVNFFSNDATAEDFFPPFSTTLEGLPAGGGAVYLDGGVFTISTGTFEGNSAKGYGGAILAQERASLTIGDSDTATLIEFIDNEAGDCGGALAVNQTIATIANAEFTDNKAQFGNFLYIADDMDPTGSGSLVSCSAAGPVKFCSGLNDMSIFAEGTGEFPNTDCGTNGVDNNCS